MLRLPHENMKLGHALDQVCRLVRKAGGRAWVVGGAVRDAVLGLPVNDLDLEVYGVDAERLESVLANQFAIDTVGRAFGVLKLHGLPIDVSLPRRESKAGLGHRGFLVQSDPSLDLEEAALRRDFTMNAMAFDPLSHDLVDPFDGRQDLSSGRLRHCSGAFVEDPLRVLRGMQFAARFGLVGDDETLALCRTIEPEGLANERVWQEWRKLLLLGRHPSLGLRFLREAGWLRHFPPLAALDGLPQDPTFHPEGDVYTHTALCLDVFAEQRVGDDVEDLVVGLAVLCHDVGKPLVQQVDDTGRIRTPGHPQAAVQVVEAFLIDLTGQPTLVRQVLPLVREHARPVQLYNQQSGDAAVRRLARDVERIDRLLRVVRADLGGRGPAADLDPPAVRWLEERAGELAIVDGGPTPIVMGRHLILLGIPAGPHVGDILNACYEAQLGGVFRDEKGGLRFLKTWLKRNDAG